MKKERVEEPDTSGEVPAYIVTFSDMVTLLLTFFVMLLSMAEVQDPELFNKGRDSFVQALNHCGLGTMFGGRLVPGLNTQKERHQTTADEPDAPRSIDARREKRRRAFERLNESMTTLSSQIVGDGVQFSVLDVGMADGQSRLTDAGRDAIWQFARNLQLPDAGRPQTLYVLGLADSGEQAQSQWTLSADRAQAVADFLRQALPEDRYSIFSWGAGPGYGWGGRDGAAAKDTQVMVGVVRNRR